MQKAVELGFRAGVARKSATTAAIMLVAAVSEVALRFTETATGTNANTVSKQKAAIPRASVISMSEKAPDADIFVIVDKFLRFRQGRLLG